MDIHHRHNRNHSPEHASWNRVLALGLAVVILALAYFVFVHHPSFAWLGF